MDVTLTTDKMGRSVAVIPDRAAALLRESSRAGWQDVADMNTGRSRLYWKGPTWETARDYLDSVPAGRNSPDLIVGASGWDAAAQWWAPGFPSWNVPTIVARHDGAIYFTG